MPVDGDSRSFGDFADEFGGDAIQVVLAGRRVQAVTVEDEEVGGVAGCDGTGRIEHQSLVGPRRGRLDEGDDLMQFRVAVELLVERVGGRATNRGGEQRDATVADVGIGRLVLGDDHDVGPADVVRRMLRRRLLVAAGDHQANMDIVVHVVALDGRPKCGLDTVSVEADVERDRRRPGEQAVEMTIEMGEDSMVETDPLPDAVTDEETRIEDGDLGFVSRKEVTVDVDLDRGVALVGEGLVRTSAHGQHARRSSPGPLPRLGLVATVGRFGLHLGRRKQGRGRLARKLVRCSIRS